MKFYNKYISKSKNIMQAPDSSGWPLVVGGWEVEKQPSTPGLI